MNCYVTIPVSLDPVRCAIDDALEAVSNMKRVLQARLTCLDGFQKRKKNRRLEGTGRMEEAVTLIREPKGRFIVVERNGDIIELRLMADLLNASEKLGAGHCSMVDGSGLLGLEVKPELSRENWRHVE